MVFEAPLLLAFTAGMVASVNPCAFSLLPAYVGLFVAGEHLDRPVEARLLRAVIVAMAVSSGFVIVFGLAGLVLEYLSGSVRRQIPWVTISVGVALAAAGVAVVAGWKPRLATRGLRFGSSGRGYGSMIGFGASYAVASLACTIGPFLAVTGVALNRSVVGGMATYVAYALGMGVIILAISVASALARTATIGTMRSLSRFAPRAGGVLMVLAGLYGIWYGRWELAVYRGDLGSDPVIDAGERWRLRVVALVENTGALRLTGLVLAVLAASIAAFATARRFERPPTSQRHEPRGGSRRTRTYVPAEERSENHCED